MEPIKIMKIEIIPMADFKAAKKKGIIKNKKKEIIKNKKKVQIILRDMKEKITVRIPNSKKEKIIRVGKIASPYDVIVINEIEFRILSTFTRTYYTS